MNIQRKKGIVSNVTDLSPTAKEVTISLDSPITFRSGSFINLFIENNGEIIRRAFSISSDEGAHNTFTLSIRRSLKGRMSPLFWEKDMVNMPIEIMGPLGLNTADKMQSKNIFLFGFGIGVGVVKSLSKHFSMRKEIQKITIATGSRNNAEVMYQDYFNALAKNDSRVSIRYIVTKNDGSTDFPEGYIQDHISDFKFNDSDVYICGQMVACSALRDTIINTNPQNINFFIEAFH